MGYEFDRTIQAVTDAAKLLSDIASNPLIAQSEYLELRELANAANLQVPALVAVIGKLKAGRAPNRHDD